jgi:NAD(P)-dependent dehydrogenase (short-subunit alcohol dehydrogenase family)
MNKVAIVTGGGSGVGRAVAVRMASEGWTVAIVGRTLRNLEATQKLADGNASHVRPFACDIADPTAVADVVKQVGDVSAVVNCAGTNIPRRSLAELSIADFESVMNANLNGALHFIREVLPGMRKAGRGTVVNVVSDAGLAANAKAGAAYVASKFALTGLTQSINAEERANGIRACAIFPGDIATPLLDKRPNPPPPEARAKMLQPEDLADCVMLCINLPDRAVVEQLVVRPS